MTDLSYVTIKNSSPQGKPKVLFCSHPDDLSEALPLISEDIFRHSDCTLWYMPKGSPPPSDKELESLLEDMQLVVFAVTGSFLYSGNTAKDKVIPLAVSQHLPLLPIMLEQGLERDFNSLCAEVQLVNRYNTDPTATPYDDTLETFLNAVLVSDETARKVRNAFDAYVFLSYRKKDRKHAKRLMRLIHQDPAFRDIAIWYDEYLVPGEGFNEAILEAFNKSSIMALTVTEHITEAHNYVKETEYRELALPRSKKDARFSVVPVEMYEKDDNRVDRKRLAADFPDLPDVQDEYMSNKVKAAFVAARKRIGISADGGDARHRFFIGLAYLCGIDVEKDYSRALELLKSAAGDAAPCFEATEKLAEMYLHGEGVEADLSQAIYWQTVLVGQYREAYDQNCQPDEHKGFGARYMKSLIRLSDLYRYNKQPEKAMSSAKQALATAEKLRGEVGVRETERDCAMTADRIGSLYRDKKDFDSAARYYGHACGVYKKLAAEIGTRRARRDLSVSYELLGDIYRESGDTDACGAHYRNAYEIRKALADEKPTHGARRDLSAILTKLGNYYKEIRQPDEALKRYKESLAIDEILCAELKTRSSEDDYAVSLSKVGGLYLKLREYADAVPYLEAAQGIYGGLTEKSSLPRYRSNYATCCEKLASAAKHMGQREKARQLYDKAIELREQLASKSASPESLHELAVSYFNCAAFREEKEMFKKALAIWERLSAQNAAYESCARKCREVIRSM